MIGRTIAAAALLAIALLPSRALAAPPNASTKACIQSFDQGQRLKTDKKLRRAQAELLLCTQETCPAVLRADCSSGLRSVQGAMPSVVFAADDGAGHDLVDVRVRAGTELLAETLDARSIELDPGSYELQFEEAGAPPVTVRYVLSEGEKNRVLRVSFRKPHVASVRTEMPVVQPRRQAAGWAVPTGLAGLGLGALAFGGISRLQFASDRDDLRATCAPDCSARSRDDLSSTVVRANVALVLGFALFAGAAVSWFVLQPGPRPSRTAAWAF